MTPLYYDHCTFQLSRLSIVLLQNDKRLKTLLSIMDSVDSIREVLSGCTIRLERLDDDTGILTKWTPS
jgi:hypothetical protein